MRNKIQRGDVLTVVAPKNLQSGELFELGSAVLIAEFDADSGEAVSGHFRGVFEVPKLKNKTVKLLQVAYFDGKAVTPDKKSGAGDNAKEHTKIGFFTRDAAQGSDYAEVLLSQ